MIVRILVLVLPLLAVGANPSVVAADEVAAQPEMQSARDLFNDQPKGLSDHVVAWKLIYAGETFADLWGGLERGAIYEGMAKVGVGVNLDMLAGWKDTALYANVIYPHGNSVTQRYTGDFNVVSNIDTSDSIRLYKLWLQKDFGDGAWSVRVGQITADKECFLSDGATLYLNNAFGTFPTFSSNIPGPIFPLSAPGARVRWAPTAALSILTMAFSGDVGSARSNPHNTDWRFDGRHGALTLTEMAYQMNHADGAAGLPGTVKLGGYYDTKSFADQDGKGSERGDYGFYAMADQLLYRVPAEPGGDGRGLGVFVRAGFAPEADRNVITSDVETGLDYTGLLPARAKDITGIGFAYTLFGDPYVRANRGTRRSEAVVELTDLVVVNEHFAVQPDVQYIANPGGLGKVRDSLAAGLRLTLSY